MICLLYDVDLDKPVVLVSGQHLCSVERVEGRNYLIGIGVPYVVIGTVGFEDNLVVYEQVHIKRSN